MAPPTHGEQLLGLGWRSGSVLPAKVHEIIRPYLHHGEEAAPEQVDPAEWLIVVSQTCDVVAFKDDAEPYVELLRAQPHAGKPRAQYRDLHSTRRLDFRPNREALPDTVLTAHATVDRFFVPRALLTGAAPNAGRILSATAERRLQAWFALRSSRPAWPNELVRRLKPAEGLLEAALEPLREEIAEVRVAISPKDRELEADTPYKMIVAFVVPAEFFDTDPDMRRLAQERFNEFARAVQSCAGIVLDTDLSGVVSGDQFTWAETRSSDHWDFAYLSQVE